ncbi:dynamin-related protein 3A [Actinidia rufa]|uniref:Dynamin-related protein 3A n=1 Tax=Actinidia rufa TaxID=165716 RepID=A0A7J0H9U8_9ERIC|nr:dynamin-related protein 3A [Actinidia rufa]
MDYINSSHPNFIGGKKAVELALQQQRSLQDADDVEKVSISEQGRKSQPEKISISEQGRKSQPVLSNQGTHPQSNNDKPGSVGKLFYLIEL